MPNARESNAVLIGGALERNMIERKNAVAFALVDSWRYWCWLIILAGSFSVNGSGNPESEISTYTPLRIFGSNVYDFTPVIQKVIPVIHKVLPGSPSPYFIRGSVQAVTAEGASIAMKGFFVTGGLPTSANILNGSARVVNYIDAEATYFVKCPPGTFVPTESVSLFAWPLGKKVFDYGKPFKGSLTGRTVFRVTEGGLVPVHYPSDAEVEEHRVSRLREIVASRGEEAARGDAFAQYDLAMRYLNGDGVKKNCAIAILWLRAAAARNSLQAKEMLETLTNTPSAKTDTLPANATEADKRQP